MADRMRHVDRFESSYVLLVLTQELAAGGKVVVDDVECLAVDAFDKAGQDDRLSTVVDVGEGYGVGTTEMKKKSKRAEPDPAVI